MWGVLRWGRQSSPASFVPFVQEEAAKEPEGGGLWGMEECSSLYLSVSTKQLVLCVFSEEAQVSGCGYTGNV